MMDTELLASNASEYSNKPEAEFQFRFRIFTLILVVILLSALGAWVGRSVYRQRLAADAVRSAGGRLLYESQTETSVRTAIDTPSPFPGAELINPVTEVDLIRYSNEQPHITDEVLARLGDLGDLKSLDLEATGIGDDALAKISGLTTLLSLRLDNNPVTDAGMVHVGRLTSLEKLWLNDTRVTADGYRHLTRLKQLKELHMSYDFTDHALSYVEQLESLEHLTIASTALTDTGLLRLTKLSRLKLLRIRAPRITDAGWEKLQKALPALKIERP